MERIATATYFSHPREYLVRLYKFGPKTFTWMSGSFRVSGLPNFRSAEAALQFATDNGWTVS